MKGALLWKRILNEGLHVPRAICPPDRPDYAREVTDKIITCPIILDPTIQPLGEYHYDWSKYIGLSIPFPNFWVEGRLSDRGFWGTKVTSHRLDDLLANRMRVPEAAGGWFVQLFACMAGFDEPAHSIGKVFIYLNRNGDLLDAAANQIRYTPALVPDLKVADSLPLDFVVADEAAKQIAQTACDVLRLIACKNVSLERHDNDPKSMRKAAKRHGGNPEKYRYHVLVVRPPGARSDSPAQEIGVMPRHVCRGHFAEYGPEFGKGLLFGKYAGRFYVPPHLKGDKKNGVVEKDYAIAGGAA